LRLVADAIPRGRSIPRYGQKDGRRQQQHPKWTALCHERAIDPRGESAATTLFSGSSSLQASLRPEDLLSAS
jgi:hypothetical protein